MSLMIDIRKLSTFNRMAKEGANTVADHLSQMTGTETRMEITKINFVETDDLQRHVGDDTEVGINIQLTEPPYGYVLMLFTETSAKNIADLMMGGMGGGDHDGFSEMEMSAVQEIGNIMTSGFIDGWANVLDTTIDMTTPEFSHKPAAEIVDSLVGDRDDEIAMVFDSHIYAPDADVEAKIYCFPELEELVEMMNSLEV
ncbi:MAG: chemotaxis protein CheC [Halobacteria archaeon]|nr:chemotaxis protein CheC [Halobacteria archaeon]